MLKSPYLKRVSINIGEIQHKPIEYPYNLPILMNGEVSLEFINPVTIIVGENGSGKSSILEAISSLCGFDQAGGGSGYRPIDHVGSLEKSGQNLENCIKAEWLPKINRGWFFRAETFFSVARYLDQAAIDVGASPPNFLSKSHGEGFIEFFASRINTRGIFILDEPESALSPIRQISFLHFLSEVQLEMKCQVIMATHSPILMAVPGATVFEISDAVRTVSDFRDLESFKLMKMFMNNPDRFRA